MSETEESAQGTLPYDLGKPQSVRDYLLDEYQKRYETLRGQAETADKDTDRVSAERAALTALGDIAKLTGAIDTPTETETVRIIIEGYPDA